MASRNVEVFRNVHDCFNRRDFDGTMESLTDGPSYVEHPSGRTLRGKDQLREFLQGWANAFSDGRIIDAQYLDAGDAVVSQFTFQGTNDGAFAGMPATGKRVSVPICEIAHYDSHGRVVSASVYYDAMTICTQLGIIKPLATAA